MLDTYEDLLRRQEATLKALHPVLQEILHRARDGEARIGSLPLSYHHNGNSHFVSFREKAKRGGIVERELSFRLEPEDGTETSYLRLWPADYGTFMRLLRVLLKDKREGVGMGKQLHLRRSETQ